MIRSLSDFAAPWRRPRLLRCSFCGRTANEVERLVAGAAAYICDACVGKCVEVLEDHGGMPMQQQAPANPETAQESNARPN